MPGPHMTIAELADELGRSTSWLYDNWRSLCKRERMPHPLHGGATPLVWSRAQVIAWLDRDLSPPEKLAAQAYRAAAAAAAGARTISSDDLAVANHRAELDAEFSRRAD